MISAARSETHLFVQVRSRPRICAYSINNVMLCLLRCTYISLDSNNITVEGSCTPPSNITPKLAAAARLECYLILALADFPSSSAKRQQRSRLCQPGRITHFLITPDRHRRSSKTAQLSVTVEPHTKMSWQGVSQSIYGSWSLASREETSLRKKADTNERAYTDYV